VHRQAVFKGLELVVGLVENAVDILLEFMSGLSYFFFGVKDIDLGSCVMFILLLSFLDSGPYCHHLLSILRPRFT